MPAIRPVKTDFGKDATEDMWRYVEESSEYWWQKTRNFREDKLKEFARLYKGIPITANRDTPWPGASNIEIQVVATNSDQLLARVMSMYFTDPLWSAKIYGDVDGGKADDQRSAIEKFLGNMASTPLNSTSIEWKRLGFPPQLGMALELLNFPGFITPNRTLLVQKG